MSVSRRNFLALAGAGVAAASMVSPLDLFYQRVSAGEITSGPGYGPLFPKLPENADELAGLIKDGFDLGTTPILELPKGFNYTAISITGQPMNDGGTVPGLHDGMAAFQGAKNTTLLVRNHEVSSGGSNPVVPSNGSKYDNLGGGTTTLVIGPDRRVRYQYASIAGTIRNCAGGPTLGAHGSPARRMFRCRAVQMQSVTGTTSKCPRPRTSAWQHPSPSSRWDVLITRRSA